jgi:hypothetical protein
LLAGLSSISRRPNHSKPCRLLSVAIALSEYIFIGQFAVDPGWCDGRRSRRAAFPQSGPRTLAAQQRQVRETRERQIFVAVLFHAPGQGFPSGCEGPHDRGTTQLYRASKSSVHRLQDGGYCQARCFQT